LVKAITPEGVDVAKTTPWGTVRDTGSGSIDLVLIDATRPLTRREIQAEVTRRKLPKRKDASPHLSTLKRKGFITNKDGRWLKVQPSRRSRRSVPKAKAAFAPSSPQVLASNVGPNESFAEGRELLRLHRHLERNPTLVQRKKVQVLARNGNLVCEVCDFDFALTYGPIGYGFAECHHLRPLAEIRTERRTTLSQLAVVCSNCHRMLHRRLTGSVGELRGIVLARRTNR
jgi:hypothetical protein